MPSPFNPFAFSKPRPTYPGPNVFAQPRQPVAGAGPALGAPGGMPPPSATRPPPPPNPALIPQAPPQRLGTPDPMGPKLTDPLPPAPGMKDPFAGVSGEQLQALMELGILPELQAGLDDQISQADALRNAPGPEGRDSGRVYTAANPLEFIGAGLQSYAGMREGKKLRSQREEALKKSAETRRTYFDLVRGVSEA